MEKIKINPPSDLDYYSREAYNTLRTNILFCGADIKTILFTSCTPDEGKTETAWHLACSMAEAGKKVLFMDADLRKSVLAARIGLEDPVKGLSHFLSGQAQATEIIYSCNVKNLYIAFAGPVPPNPSELLGSWAFEGLIDAAKKVYDYIIIDTPPLGNVIDAAVVGHVADGAILVLESGKDSYRVAQRVKEQLLTADCKVLGAVLSKVSHKGGGYYNGAYYGKYYGKYYGNDAEKKSAAKTTDGKADTGSQAAASEIKLDEKGDQ